MNWLRTIKTILYHCPPPFEMAKIMQLYRKKRSLGNWHCGL